MSPMRTFVYTVAILVAAPAFAGAPTTTESAPSVEPETRALAFRTSATYSVERAVLDRLVASNELASAARFVPSMKDGKFNGYKVYAIRPNSLLGQLDLMNGDTLKRANGLELSSPEKALEAYTKLKNASHLTFEIERRGEPFTLTINVVTTPLPVAARAASTYSPSPPVPIDPVLAAELERGIQCANNRCTVDRALMDKLLSNTAQLAASARMVPSIKNGKPNGFKVYAIRPLSIYARLGFENGDTLQTINDLDLTSPDKALEAYTKLRAATTLTVGIERRGQTITREYSIR